MCETGACEMWSPEICELEFQSTFYKLNDLFCYTENIVLQSKRDKKIQLIRINNFNLWACDGLIWFDFKAVVEDTSISLEKAIQNIFRIYTHIKTGQLKIKV